MPFTIYGMLLWIPNTLLYLRGHQYSYFDKRLLGLNIQRYLYIAYMTHYLFINFRIGLLVLFVYAFPLYYARKRYIDSIYSNHILYGLSISTISLTIQEIFGHYYGGDGPSRPEATFNAILYATYFSVGHFFR